MSNFSIVNCPLYPPNGGLYILQSLKVCSSKNIYSELQLSKLPSHHWGRAACLPQAGGWGIYANFQQTILDRTQVITFIVCRQKSKNCWKSL